MDEALRQATRNPEVERRLLAALLAEPRRLIGCGVGVRDFSEPRHRRLFTVIADHVETEQPVDAVIAADELERAGDREARAWVTDIALAEPTLLSFARDVLRECSQRRRIVEYAEAAHEVARTPGPLDEDTVLRAADGIIAALSDTQDGILGVTARVAASAAVDRAYDNRGTEFLGVPTGFGELDTLLDGLQRGNLLLLAARPSQGKAQPLTASVKTVAGWTTMGALRVGDVLASPDGGPSRVLAIHPQGFMPVYRVTFADGRVVEATAEHRWTIRGSRFTGQRTVTTLELGAMIQRVRHAGRVFVPLATGDFGHRERLPIHPYVLGALLGDGDLTQATPRLTSADQELADRVGARLPKTMTIRKLSARYAYSLCQRYGYKLNKRNRERALQSPLTIALRKFGLLGTDCYSKFIPRLYLEAPKSARIELLRGLLDTDGTVEPGNYVRFSTSSPRLARDVQHLAWSLGAVCHLRERARPTYRSRDGERMVGAPHYVVTIRHRDRAKFFTLARKRARLSPSYRWAGVGLGVASVELAREAACQCITVSHPTGLYLTTDFVVTHNSAFAQQVALNMGAAGRTVFVFSPEMTAEQVGGRFLSLEIPVDLRRARMDYVEDESPVWGRLRGIAASLPGSVYLQDDSGATSRDIEVQARRMGLQQKPDCIVVDHVHFLGDRPLGRESREDVLAHIARRLKTLARRLDCPVLALAQLNRESERGGKVREPMLSDLRGSGALEQDADVVMFLHRPDYYDVTDQPGLAKLLVRKNRNGPIRDLAFNFQRERTRFTPWTGI